MWQSTKMNKELRVIKSIIIISIVRALKMERQFTTVEEYNTYISQFISEEFKNSTLWMLTQEDVESIHKRQHTGLTPVFENLNCGVSVEILSIFKCSLTCCFFCFCRQNRKKKPRGGQKSGSYYKVRRKLACNISVQLECFK